MRTVLLGLGACLAAMATALRADAAPSYRYCAHYE